MYILQAQVDELYLHIGEESIHLLCNNRKLAERTKWTPQLELSLTLVTQRQALETLYTLVSCMAVPFFLCIRMIVENWIFPHKL